MYPRNPQLGLKTHPRTAFAAAMLLIVALAGCASQLAPTAADTAPYVGTFTGEFVDGRPLYRFPTIEVVGWRSSIGPGT